MLENLPQMNANTRKEKRLSHTSLRAKRGNLYQATVLSKGNSIVSSVNGSSVQHYCRDVS